MRRHIVGSAWIANPIGVSLSEEQAALIYDVTGAWAHVESTQAARLRKPKESSHGRRCSVRPRGQHLQRPAGG